MGSLRGGKIAQEESGLLGCLNGYVALLWGSELRETNRVCLVLIVHLSFLLTLSLFCPDLLLWVVSLWEFTCMLL